MFVYLYTQLDLFWISFIPYLIIGAAALPIILMSLIYGWLQILLISIGFIDVSFTIKNFLSQIFLKLTLHPSF